MREGKEAGKRNPLSKKQHYCDWRESPANVLEEVDEALKEYDLEVVSFDTGSDSYGFYIDKRSKYEDSTDP